MVPFLFLTLASSNNKTMGKTRIYAIENELGEVISIGSKVKPDLSLFGNNLNTDGVRIVKEFYNTPCGWCFIDEEDRRSFKNIDKYRLVD